MKQAVTIVVSDFDSSSRVRLEVQSIPDRLPLIRFTMDREELHRALRGRAGLHTTFLDGHIVTQ